MNDKRRTGVDFSKHKLTVIQDGSFLIHDLKVPDSPLFRVKFINGHGIMVVTGDYYRWSFCREFHPSPTGRVSDSYWVEKILIGSLMRDVNRFDSNYLSKEFDELLEDYKDECDPEQYKELQEFVKECIYNSDDEHSYVNYAYSHKPNFISYEYMPTGRVLHPQLNIIFDAFEEICQRLKEGNYERKDNNESKDTTSKV